MYNLPIIFYTTMYKTVYKYTSLSTIPPRFSAVQFRYLVHFKWFNLDYSTSKYCTAWIGLTREDKTATTRRGPKRCTNAQRQSVYKLACRNYLLTLYTVLCYASRMVKSRVQLRLEPELLARLQAVADASGHKLSEVIRIAARKALPEFERRVGIVKPWYTASGHRKSLELSTKRDRWYLLPFNEARSLNQPHARIVVGSAADGI